MEEILIEKQGFRFFIWQAPHPRVALALLNGTGQLLVLVPRLKGQEKPGPPGKYTLRVWSPPGVLPFILIVGEYV